MKFENRVFVSVKVAVETSVLFEKIRAEIEGSGDSKAFLRRELPRVRNLRRRYIFVVYESVLGELIGQIYTKVDNVEIFRAVDRAIQFIIADINAEIIRTRCGRTVLRIFNELMELEWDNDVTWGMDIYDMWHCSQILSDDSCAILWTKDRRMLNSSVLRSSSGLQEKLIRNGIRHRPLQVVDTLKNGAVQIRGNLYMSGV